MIENDFPVFRETVKESMIGRSIAWLVAAVAVAAAAISTSAFAGINGAFLVPVSMPTLSEIGLGLLVVLLGAVGGYVVRRKK